MPARSPRTTNIPAVSVQNLNVSYGSVSVLRDISFTIKQGTIAAVIGPNGSGKSTLVRTILGLLPPTSGSVSLFGKPVSQQLARIGYVPQSFAFDRQFPITVYEFLRLAARSANAPEAIDTAVKEVGLMPAVLHEQLGALSGGQLQRVLIAQAILNSPDLLFLDEPSAGIDVAGEAAFYDVIEHLRVEHGTTIVLISHDVSMVARTVDQVICLNRELVCSTTPRRALTKKNLEKLFGDAGVYEHVHRH